MTDTVIISSDNENKDTVNELTESVEDAVEELTETVEDAVDELTETVEDAVDELAETVEEQEDKLSWLVNSVSTMQEQISTLSEVVTGMATLLIPPQSPETIPETETVEIMEPMNISETSEETSSIPLPDDLESVANPEPILNQEVRKIIRVI